MKVNDKFYNEALQLEIQKAVERTGVSSRVLGELLEISQDYARRIVKLEQSIVRSDVERKAVVVVKLLNDLADQKLLPIDTPKNNPRYSDKLFEIINQYLDKIS